MDAPISEPLTYLVPENLRSQMKRGVLVHLPLGKRKARGLALQPLSEAPSFELKNISSIDLEYPALPEPFLKWLEWISSYYLHPIGSVTSLAYPPLHKTVKTRKSQRPPVVAPQPQQAPLTLTNDQRRIVESIRKASGFSTHLLFGVTGSGKTEVYLQLLEQILAQKQKGLVLVPEISLTPQLIQRFAARFGDQIAVLHSQLTDRERTNQWWDIVENRKSILIGARSALFCPIENLGLIIVDEEHEPSFKQEDKLKYHGRDAAVMMGKLSSCPVILGSATPSLESWKNTLEGKYVLHEMPSRVENRSLPTIEIVDLRTPSPEKGMNSPQPRWLSPPLKEAMIETLRKKEQVALFLNRRGVAPLVVCPECGYTHECPNCDISLTLHGRSHLVCHYCDYHENFQEICPDCHQGEMTALGLGTETIEKDISQLFPEARIARADRDEITSRTDLEELIKNMERRDIDILVGTQMIAKGLDFPSLTLVGLVLADVGFNLPDFRATERSFQLITQVSGRAGRHIKPGELPGRVIVQTYNPDHPSLLFAKNHDYKGFAQEELRHREALLYPPYGRLITLRIQGGQLSRVQEAARLTSRRAQQLKSSQTSYQTVEVLGPAQAPIGKLRGQFRHHLLLKNKDSRLLNSFCRQLVADEKWLPPGVRLSADVDPFHLL